MMTARGDHPSEATHARPGRRARAGHLPRRRVPGGQYLCGIAGIGDRLVSLDGFRVDAVPKGYMLVITNEDKPGVVGSVGTLLGKHKINIAEMTLGRKHEGAYAITVINTDNAVPTPVLKELKSLKLIIDVKLVKL